MSTCFSLQVVLGSFGVSQVFFSALSPNVIHIV